MNVNVNTGARAHDVTITPVPTRGYKGVCGCRPRGARAFSVWGNPKNLPRITLKSADLVAELPAPWTLQCELSTDMK